MTSPERNRSEVRHEQGFSVYVIGNQQVEVAVVPELGARISSLKDLRTGRNWMWHPAGGLKLFRNRPGNDFSAGPLVGMDECLPTIAPCSWQGRQLPDHGEVWAVPWNVDGPAWARGVLRTSIDLMISPLALERTLELRGNQIHLAYRLTNRSSANEQYLWALHPLLRLQKGDRLELPPTTRALLNGAPWLDALDTAKPAGNCAKLFATPLSEGRAAITNENTLDRLEFKWNAAKNNTLGLWLTRGGWHGHHHFALEPSNSASDALGLAADKKNCGVVPARHEATWQVCLRIGS